MPGLRHVILLALLAGPFAPVFAQTAGERLAAAQREGAVVIYAVTDREIVQSVIDDFEARHPGVRVAYHDMQSNEAYRRIVEEAGSEAARAAPDGAEVADVVWSSAMDLQVKLVNDGYARPHRSTETAALPGWAVWKEEAFGTTYEPVVMAYDRDALAADEVPDSHAALIRLLAAQPERFTGRVATYDPERSGLGLLLLSQDAQANPTAFWQLAHRLGALGVRRYPTSAQMLDAIAAGEILLGYNLLGSYALERARRNPRIGIVWPRDYTLVLSRVALITRHGRHPEAARLWLDYLLSPQGQRMLAESAGLHAVREGVSRHAASDLRSQLGGAFRPIPIGTGLLAYLDQSKQQDFLRQWEAAMAP
ncbi:ABC transporter substrate-binding protein [Pseudothauera nasutitermitis]|uniref:ABC transporter substrate-binding protein n=1 Tax=Pseudothauera nasutitermitis TaxID=2565930 RepID=A0A4S4AWX1_9RHOO|nr:ABC transporter substrate-binding protein [Pseudothauera nasutitermitis]THF64514.1 ABC transporter substrate-binding protein [Pseudothauera nasutitermitis]